MRDFAQVKLFVEKSPPFFHVLLEGYVHLCGPSHDGGDAPKDLVVGAEGD